MSYMPKGPQWLTGLVVLKYIQSTAETNIAL